MSASRPVGINTTLSTSTTSAQSSAFQQQCDSLRIVAESAGVYVTYGGNPTATNENFYVSSYDTAEISLGPVSAQRVVNVTPGTSTIIDFPEGTGSPFDVGDIVTLTASSQSQFNFEHQTVTAVNNTANVGGYFSTRITVSYNSSSVTDTFTDPDATLRKSFKVAVKTESGTGKAYIQQVQRS
jgi:hypothetical protein